MACIKGKATKKTRLLVSKQRGEREARDREEGRRGNEERNPAGEEKKEMGDCHCLTEQQEEKKESSH